VRRLCLLNAAFPDMHILLLLEVYLAFLWNLVKERRRLTYFLILPFNSRCIDFNSINTHRLWLKMP
jgi:hypothetical protein